MIGEVACDESGSEGEKLVGGVTDVFAHAGVGLSTVAAQECVAEIRDRIRSPAQEYKANHLLRDKHRAVLVWLLSDEGPILGQAHVLLVDKTLFLVSRMVDLLIGDGDVDLANTLHVGGPKAFGPARWAAFLESFNSVVRVRNRRGDRVSVDSFFQDIDYLLRFRTEEQVQATLGAMAGGRQRIEDYRASLARDPNVMSTVDPMVPAIVRTVRHWSTDGPIEVVHDEQLSLTESRIAQLKQLCDGRLAGLRLVDSRLDARVQVADFLAGVARRIASDELNGNGDDELITLLRPYVTPTPPQSH
ncbi:DUF3800 domain-containing protein [Actinophytocola sediminis]